LSPEVYFSLPATAPSSSQHVCPHESLAAGLPGLLQLLPDTVTLRTFLVSTTFTQNETLLRLLHWEQQLGASSNFEDLKTVLTQFTFVGEVEVVKFLSDIFDALFAIVMHPKNSDGGLDDLVLKALVTVLSIVQDRRVSQVASQEAL
jgi:dedicator of cytokinesis protein 3